MGRTGGWFAPDPGRLHNRRVAVVARALLAFGVLISASAWAYPGGTWRTRASPGFSFWQNFWCDLLSTRALNGQSSWLAAGLSRAAFACFALALYRFWPLAAERASPARPSPTAQKAGQLGALCLLAVAVVPAASSQLLHAVAVLLATGSSLFGVSLLLRALLRQGEPVAALLGLATLLVSGLCLALYVVQGLGYADVDALAGLQKLATAPLLAFMVQLLLRSRSPRARASTDTQGPRGRG